MNVSDYMKQMKKGSKKDDIPGTVEKYLDEICPACGKNLKLMKPCCGSPYGIKECPCGWKVSLTS